MVVGKSEKRVDGYDKVTGKAQYTDDLMRPLPTEGSSP